MKDMQEWLDLAVINAVGYATRVGGSRPDSAVLEAMYWAQQHYFEIDDLLARSEQIIARETGAESGLVTCSASAALTLAAAAVLADENTEIMDRLPDVSGIVRNQFLYPVRGRFDYDHPVRASGGKLVEFDFHAEAMEERLQSALNDKIAAVVFVWMHCEDHERIRRIARVCQSVKVPFILDAAMSLPPEENLRELVGMGADLIALSGGKHLGGPQNSGLLFGRRRWIRSAWLQMVDMDVRPRSWSLRRWMDVDGIPVPPRHGIGRGFKVGKDVIVGCMVALQRYARRDFAAERARWHEICRRIIDEVPQGAGYQLEYLESNGTGQYPVIRFRAKSGERMDEMKSQLANGRPKIVMAEDEEDRCVSWIYPICLNQDEVTSLIERISKSIQNET